MLPGNGYGSGSTYGSARFLKSQDPDTGRNTTYKKYNNILKKFKNIVKVKNKTHS